MAGNANNATREKRPGKAQLLLRRPCWSCDKDGKKLEFGIWSDSGFVGTLGAREAVSLRLRPGSHFFMAGNLGVTQMRADVEAGKQY